MTYFFPDKPLRMSKGERRFHFWSILLSLRSNWVITYYYIYVTEVLKLCKKNKKLNTSAWLFSQQENWVNKQSPGFPNSVPDILRIWANVGCYMK